MDWLAARKREHELATKNMEQQQLKDTQDPLPQIEDSTIEDAPKQSRFLSLPAELRNAIYSALFPPSDPDKDSDGHVQRIKSSYRLPGLLLTCKQIHSECMGLYYSNTIFRCLDETSAVNWLANLPRRWLNLVPEVRYDTRWIIFVTPFIPVPGAEGWLFQNLVCTTHGY